MSHDFELGRNLSGDFRKSLTYLLLMVIWVCLSDILLTIRRQAVRSRNTSTCHVTNGRGICWRQRGCGGGSKIAIFLHTHLHSMPTSPYKVCYGKTRTVWLTESEKFDYMFSRFDTIPACDRKTDGQTDRRTSCDSIVRTMDARRAVKMIM